MGSRVPSRERAEVELIRMGYRKDAHGNYWHQHVAAAGLSRLDLETLTPFQVVREGRRMLDGDRGEHPTPRPDGPPREA